ncbi:MAG: LPXTG cell wall anchor domain-containing protein [Oscillospiraceae bacterium]|nr:LPXTG cell wall anchor domain-containing protein [Oscillospiraceae bacterium]
MNDLILFLMMYVPMTSDDTPIWLIPAVIVSLALIIVLIVIGRKRKK